MRFRLIPSDDAFFGLFNDSAGNVAECARRLRDLLSDPVDPAAHEKIAACEHRGDELVRTIVQRLNTTFVTPFDREDIHALAESSTTSSTTCSRCRTAFRSRASPRRCRSSRSRPT